MASLSDNIKLDENIGHLTDQIVAVWSHGFMGIDIGKIIIALGILLGFLIIRGIFSKYILYRLHKFASKTDNTMDDEVVEALIPPIKFIPIIMGLFFAGQYMELEEPVYSVFSNLIRSLIVFNIFWALHRAIEPVSHMFKRLEKILTRAMVQWIFKVIRFLIVFIGAAVILEVWGIQVGPLLAGLGLFGAAVALGAQDLFKNLIGGLTIIAEKRYHPGEWIKVDGVVEGTVEEIGFRSTRVRRFDKAPVHVPNAHLSDAAVTNFSRMTNRRIYWKIGVVYSTTTEQLKTIRDGILKYINENEAFETGPSVSTFVRIDSFNDSSIDLMIYCFTKTTIWGEWLEIKEDFAFEIKNIVEKAGSSFAFPSTSIYLESFPEDIPETFIPPNKTKAKKSK